MEGTEQTLFVIELDEQLKNNHKTEPWKLMQEIYDKLPEKDYPKSIPSTISNFHISPFTAKAGKESGLVEVQPPMHRDYTEKLFCGVYISEPGFWVLKPEIKDWVWVGKSGLIVVRRINLHLLRFQVQRDCEFVGWYFY